MKKSNRRDFILKSTLFGSSLMVPPYLMQACKKKEDGLSWDPFDSLEIVSRETSQGASRWHKAVYLGKNSFNLRSGDYVSFDNGNSWGHNILQPDFTKGLPYGFRREYVVSVFDDNTNRYISFFNSLDVPELDPDIFEPPIAQETYYLRYRASEGGIGDWLFDEVIMETGDYTTENPFPGIHIGKNSIYLGDVGSKPIINREGKILMPVQTTPLGPDGKLWNPGKGFTYTDAVVLIGSWNEKGKLLWTMSDRIEGDPERSTRGMIEPTILETENGRILMVMRGSNDKALELPSYKWASVSDDGGMNWTKPEPFAFEDGSPFFSPSSMSTLFKHSSGRCFWIGNITDENCKGNLPRWPLVMAQLNTKTLKLIKSSLLVIDTFREEDKSRSRLDISHFSLIEDRATNEIILTYPRSYHAYESKEWITTRIAVE